MNGGRWGQSERQERRPFRLLEISSLWILTHCRMECKLVPSFGKAVWHQLLKLKIHVSYDPVFLSPAGCTREIMAHLHPGTHVSMFIVTHTETPKSINSRTVT